MRTLEDDKKVVSALLDLEEHAFWERIRTESWVLQFDLIRAAVWKVLIKEKDTARKDLPSMLVGAEGNDLGVSGWEYYFSLAILYETDPDKITEILKIRFQRHSTAKDFKDDFFALAISMDSYINMDASVVAERKKLLCATLKAYCAETLPDKLKEYSNNVRFLIEQYKESLVTSPEASWYALSLIHAAWHLDALPPLGNEDGGFDFRKNLNQSVEDVWQRFLICIDSGLSSSIIFPGTATTLDVDKIFISEMQSLIRSCRPSRTTAQQCAHSEIDDYGRHIACPFSIGLIPRKFVTEDGKPYCFRHALELFEKSKTIVAPSIAVTQPAPVKIVEKDSLQKKPKIIIKTEKILRSATTTANGEEKATKSKSNSLSKDSNTADSPNGTGNTSNNIVYMKRIEKAREHCRHGVAFEKAGSNSEAQSEFEEAIRLDSNYPSAHYSLGVVLCNLAQPLKAIMEFRKAIELNPNDGDYYFGLANALDDADQPQKAIEEFDNAIAKQKDNPDYHYNKSLVLEKLGKKREAKIEHTIAIRLGYK